MVLNRSMKTFRLLFCQQSKSASSRLGFLKSMNHKPVPLNKSEFKLIYSFEYMPLIAAVMRSKKSVTVASFVSIPFLYHFDESLVSPYIVAISASIYFAFGIVWGKLAQNLIGKIYVNKEGELKHVIVSSVNNYGKRIDRMHNAEDFINNDFPNKISQYFGFTIINIENTNLLYKLNVVNGKCIEPYICDVLFGTLHNPKVIEKLIEERSIKKDLREQEM